MEFALGFMIFVIGAVAGALIASAFVVDRLRQRARFDGDYLVFDGPLTPERMRQLKEVWSERFSELSRRPE